MQNRPRAKPMEWMLLAEQDGGKKAEETNYRKTFIQKNPPTRTYPLRPQNQNPARNVRSNQPQSTPQKCFKCGNNTVHNSKNRNHEKCYAYNKPYETCNIVGHFSEMYRRNNPNIFRKFLATARQMEVTSFDSEEQLYRIID